MIYSLYDSTWFYFSIFRVDICRERKSITLIALWLSVPVGSGNRKSATFWQEKTKQITFDKGENRRKTMWDARRNRVFFSKKANFVPWPYCWWYYYLWINNNWRYFVAFQSITFKLVFQVYYRTFFIRIKLMFSNFLNKDK